MPAAAPGELAATVLAELEERGQAESVNGRLALTLARRIDLSTLDTGSSMAALVRELRLVLEAISGSASPASPVDELRRKREERMRAGGD